MGETGLHVRVSFALLGALDLILRGRKDVYVGANLFIYLREGDPKQVVCPDAFVVFGTRPEERRTWKMWEEGGRFPDLVFEVVSESSRLTDDGARRGAYEKLGVREYFLFDPERVGPGPALWGYERKGERLVRMAARPRAGGEVRLRSRLLGHFVESEGALLRLRNARTGEPVLRLDEQATARARAEREVVRLRKLVARGAGRRRE